MKTPADGTMVLAAVALLAAVPMDVLAFVCAVGAQRATSKGDGVFWGFGLASFVASAAVCSIISIPAIRRHPDVRWPCLAFVLGLVPLPLLFAAEIAERIIRSFGL